MIAILIIVSVTALVVTSVAVSSDRWDDIKLKLHEWWLQIQIILGGWRIK